MVAEKLGNICNEEQQISIVSIYIKCIQEHEGASSHQQALRSRICKLKYND